MRSFIIMSLLIIAGNLCFGQVKIYTAQTAGALVNKSSVTTMQASNTAIGTTSTPLKSSVSASNIASPVFLNNKKIKIGYQLPATHTMEWMRVRTRAANILDQYGPYLWENNRDLYYNISSLALNDFVTMSSYAPLNIKLDFRYNKIKIYKEEVFVPAITGAVLHTKTLSIKK